VMDRVSPWRETIVWAFGWSGVAVLTSFIV
jgi:hypothetical protein